MILIVLCSLSVVRIIILFYMSRDERMHVLQNRGVIYVIHDWCHLSVLYSYLKVFLICQRNVIVPRARVRSCNWLDGAHLL